MHKIQFKRKILLSFFSYLLFWSRRKQLLLQQEIECLQKLQWRSNQFECKKSLVEHIHLTNPNVDPKNHLLKNISGFDAILKKNLIGRKVILTFSFDFGKKKIKSPKTPIILSTLVKGFLIILAYIVQKKWNL